MNLEDNEVSMGLLQVLYVNCEKTPGFSVDVLADALKYNRVDVERKLDDLVIKGLVEAKNDLYSISSKGYSMVYQRETSYCPHL